MWISGMEIYVVKAGDNVDAIAAFYGISVEQLTYDNQLIYPYELAIGQALLFSTGMREARRAIRVGGYAYPFISRWVLNETLPYLSELYILYSVVLENILEHFSVRRQQNVHHRSANILELHFSHRQGLLLECVQQPCS